MPPRRSSSGPNVTSELPGHARILAEIGPETLQATTDLKAALDRSPLLMSRWKPEGFAILAEALRGWTDQAAAAVVKALREHLESDANLELTALSRWIGAHHRDSRAVIDCLSVDPPEEISIIQLLSRAGSQKVVFLANWHIAQREVVLKRFIGTEAAERLITRELQPHPLSMDHPNIIETHLLKDRRGERFLVERRLPVVLNDGWRSPGVHEAANLLYDLGNALAFLEDKQLIHGDVKPDNIGYEDGNYILLDFGICRPAEAFAEDATPTGSLRTRAPELLVGERMHSYASDIWALGATVYNTVAGRFPLFECGEVPPRVSHPPERAAYEDELRKRVRTEWDSRVDLSKVPEPLRELLSKALAREPERRAKAAQGGKLCEGDLAAFLRGSQGPGRFSPYEGLEQLKAHLPHATVLALMPHSKKHELRALLRRLEDAKGLTAAHRTDIASLRSRIE